MNKKSLFCVVHLVWLQGVVHSHQIGASSMCGYTYEWSDKGPILFDGSNGAVHTLVEEVGSKLEATTGVYTAGVDGVYELSFSGVCSMRDGDNMYVSLIGAETGEEDKFLVYASYSGGSGRVTSECSAKIHVMLLKDQEIYLQFKQSTGSPSIERVKWCTTLYSGINNNTALTTSTGLAPDILVPGENIDSLNSPMKAKDSTSLAVGASSMCGYVHEWSSAGPILFDGSHGWDAAVHQLVEEVGSQLEPTTGVYTAGVDGVYVLSFSGVCGMNVRENLYVSLMGSETGEEEEYFIESGYNGNGDRVADQCSNTIHVRLQKGQEVFLQFTPFSGKPSIGWLKWCITLYTTVYSGLNSNNTFATTTSATTTLYNSLINNRTSPTKTLNTDPQLVKSSVFGYTSSWSDAGPILFDESLSESWDTVAVHELVEEVGSKLEPTTGVYTAGVDGVYELSISGVCILHAGDYLYVSLVGAGTEEEDDYFIDSGYFGEESSSVSFQCSATIHVMLIKGQEIYLQFTNYTGSPRLGWLHWGITLYTILPSSGALEMTTQGHMESSAAINFVYLGLSLFSISVVCLCFLYLVVPRQPRRPASSTVPRISMISMTSERTARTARTSTTSMSSMSSNNSRTLFVINDINDIDDINDINDNNNIDDTNVINKINDIEDINDINYNDMNE